MSGPRLPLRVFLGLVVFSLAGSLFSRLTHLEPGPVAPLASLFTLAAGVWATFAEYVGRVAHPWPRLTIVLIFGAAAELVGLATGFPFGRYTYTNAWWPTVQLPFGPFPLLLPFAWLLMAGAASLSLPQGRLSPWLGGLLAATVDLVMEPVLAGPLHYWRWLERGSLPGGAPLANALGWWATATVAGLVLAAKTPPSDARSPRGVLVGFSTLIVGLGLIASF